MAPLLAIVLAGGFLAVQVGRQVYASYAIGERAEALEGEIAAVEAENRELERQLAYLRSDAFVTQEARRLANLGWPGEQVLIIPAGAEAAVPEQLRPTEPPQPLLEQWVRLFFGD